MRASRDKERAPAQPARDDPARRNRRVVKRAAALLAKRVLCIPKKDTPRSGNPSLFIVGASGLRPLLREAYSQGTINDPDAPSSAHEHFLMLGDTRWL